MAFRAVTYKAWTPAGGYIGKASVERSDHVPGLPAMRGRAAAALLVDHSGLLASVVGPDQMADRPSLHGHRHLRHQEREAALLAACGLEAAVAGVLGECRPIR